MIVTRFPENPIIVPHMDESMGDNINGPSLIRVPEWIPHPLGRYYLYFSHHGGAYIRLAYADDLSGPWRLHSPGVLALEQAHFQGHIASPDVHVDAEERRIRMYYHGVEEGQGQMSRVALSNDGLNFEALPEIVGLFYFRAFPWQGMTYGMVMRGVFYRSVDGLGDFEQGPTLFGEQQRHCAVRLDGDVLTVYYTNAGDCPERIVASRIQLQGDWQHWRASEPEEVLAPELDYEGAGLPLEPSCRGAVQGPARQLRDPCIFREDGRTYLLYAVAGEYGIAIARLTDEVVGPANGEGGR